MTQTVNLAAPPKGCTQDIPADLVSVVVARIKQGALNGRTVPHLAAEFRMSDRHLRRVFRDKRGQSPIEFAQALRLARAKRLLMETTLPVTRVAFASGFRSLRRFHAVFREHFDMSPTELRGRHRAADGAWRCSKRYRPAD